MRQPIAIPVPTGFMKLTFEHEKGDYTDFTTATLTVSIVKDGEEIDLEVGGIKTAPVFTDEQERLLEAKHLREIREARELAAVFDAGRKVRAIGQAFKLALGPEDDNTTRMREAEIALQSWWRDGITERHEGYIRIPQDL